MKKFIKRLFGFVVCLALAVALVRVGPYVYERLFGGADTQWISEQFSQTLREKNELVVYEVEVTGQETVTQDAWLLGTVQKVEMPYTFRMSFTVDLSLAVVSALDDGVEVRVPPPVAAYPKLIVQEDQVRTYDWLYPLTPERYSAIKQETEDRLFSDYGANEGYLSSAWDVTVRNLESLFRSVAEQRGGAWFGTTASSPLRQARFKFVHPFSGGTSSVGGLPPFPFRVFSKCSKLFTKYEKSVTISRNP